MTTVRIPASLKAAQTELAELGQLATATEWHRAAIVAAFVDPSSKGGRPGPGNRSILDGYSAQEFARLGIHGLSSASTVLIYAKAWLDRLPRPKPGAKVTLPKDPWPPTDSGGTRGYETEEGAERTIERLIEKHGPAIIASAVRKPAVAKAVLDDPDAHLEMIREENRRINTTPRPRDRGGKELGAMEDVMAREAFQTDAGAFRDAAKRLLDTVSHFTGTYAFRVGERERVVAKIDFGLQDAINAKAVLTAEVTDEALKDLLT